MRTRIINLLFSMLLVSGSFAAASVAVHAQTPQPPPPPAKDYFPDKWDEYTSQAGKFRIRFPAKPREGVNKQGELEVQTMEHKGLLNYRISFVDYKTPIDDPEKVKNLLQGIKTAALTALQDKGLRVVADREITVDGAQGVFVHLEMQGKEVIRLQWVVAGSRLFTIVASGRKGTPSEMEGQNDYEKVGMGFLNSFHLIP